MTLQLLAGCLDRLYESPLVLASGHGEVRSLTPDGGEHLVLATSRGLVRLAGDGSSTVIDPLPATAVSAHPGRLYVLRDGRVDGVEVPGAVDVLGAWDPEPLVLWPDALRTLGGETRLAGLDDARAVALGPDRSVLVVTRTALLRDGEPIVALEDGRAAGIDGQGRIYVVDGEELWRVDGATRTLAARYLADARDLHFGMGGLLAAENVFLAGGGGTVDYLRPAP